MFQLTIFLIGLVGVALASPQWYNSGFGGHHASASAPLGPDGRVVDTPEVHHLKSTHLATLAEAASRAPKGPSNYGIHDGDFNDIFNSHDQASYGHSGSYDGPRYYGPPAPLGPDGRVVDTPEVEAAKAHHFALYKAAAQQISAQQAASPSSPSSYQNVNSGYDSGEYNPAWDSPTYNSRY